MYSFKAPIFPHIDPASKRGAPPNAVVPVSYAHLPNMCMRVWKRLQTHTALRSPPPQCLKEPSGVY